MKQRLGELLVTRGWVTPAELNRALRAQRRVGGRLGTCLLETGAVTEAHLEKALSQLHHVPAAGSYYLTDVEDVILAELPPSLAIKHQALPFNAHRASVDVAFLNPRDLVAHDDVGFSIGRRIRPHVASEVRIAEALHLHYGQRPSTRLAVLIDRMSSRADNTAASEGKGTEEGARGRPPETPYPSVEIAERVAGIIPEPPALPTPPMLPPQAIRLTAEERSRLRFGLPSPKRSVGDLFEASLSRAIEQLDATGGRDEVAEILLDLLDALADRTALFKVQGDRVRGWIARPAGLDIEAFAGFDLGLERPSVFHNLREGAPFHLGALPDHRELARCWNAQPPSTALVVPVRVKDRLVAAMYAADSNGGEIEIDPAVFDPLSRAAARALKRCIVLKKQAASHD